MQIESEDVSRASVEGRRLREMRHEGEDKCAFMLVTKGQEDNILGKAQVGYSKDPLRSTDVRRK